MSITDEAVEAAVVSLYGDGVLDEVIEPRTAVRAALEAAAEHLLTEARTEAWDVGREMALMHISPKNPYRSES